MIKDHLRGAIAALEAEKENGVSTIKDKILREQILPYNAKVDESVNTAINELKDKKNNEIAEIEERFRNAKQELLSTAEATKKEFAAEVIAKETQEFNARYDRIIENIKNQLSTFDD